MLLTTDVAPPVIDLGRLVGWRPLPLSVRDARRQARPLRDRIAATPVPAQRRTAPRHVGTVTLRARNIVVRYGTLTAVRGVHLELMSGQVTALMGRNGSGKSSLLWALQGSGPRQSGTVDVEGTDPQSLPATKARTLVGLVPQNPADLLYLDTVAQECAQADRESDGASPVPARTLLHRLAPGIADNIHPRDLSEGQRLSLVLALQLTAAPQVVLLDEPTRGLDYRSKRALAAIIDQLSAQGRAVLISTHDVEFAAAVADRVVVLAAGDIVADGPTPQVVVASPAFAPQISKILAPLCYLTIDQVADTMAELG
jgi:energy-coupling factor transport system ATP-binding protein